MEAIQKKNKFLSLLILLLLGYSCTSGPVFTKFKAVPNNAWISNEHVRFDFSIRDGITIVRTLEGNNGEDSYIPTAGIRTVSIRPSVDYKINDALNFRMFYNRNSNNPVTSNSFPSALTDFGVSIRYTLQ